MDLKSIDVQGWLDWFAANKEAFEAIDVILGIILAALIYPLFMTVKWLFNRQRPSEEKDASPTNNSETNIKNNGDGNAAGRDIHVTHNYSNPSDLDRYIQSIERQLSGLQDRLERANADKGALSSENRVLLDRINELKAKLAKAATEFEQAQKRVADMEQSFAAYSNTIDPEQLEQARRMLRDFDFDGAEKIFRRIVEANELNIQQSASAEFGLGQIAEERVDWRAAYHHYKRAYDFDNDNRQYADAYAKIAWRMGRYPEAVQIRETALQQVRDAGQQGTENHAKALNNLAGLYHAQGDYARAKPLYEQALSIRRRVLGNDHPDTAGSLNNLTSLYKTRGDFARAKPMYDEALSIYRRVFGNDHPDTASSLNNLAKLYSDQGRYTDAEPLLKEAVEIIERTLGAEHPTTKLVRENYERVLAEMKE